VSQRSRIPSDRSAEGAVDDRLFLWTVHPIIVCKKRSPAPSNNVRVGSSNRPGSGWLVHGKRRADRAHDPFFFGALPVRIIADQKHCRRFGRAFASRCFTKAGDAGAGTIFNT